MRLSRIIRVGTCGLVCITLTLAWPAGIAKADTKPHGESAGSTTQEKQWHEALALVVSGQFEKGSQLIRQVKESGLGDEHIERVDTWLADFDKVQGDRSKLRAKDYERYVGWVKEDMEQKQWRRAIINCDRAYSNTVDQEAFRKEPWLLKAVGGATQRAQEYEKEGKWYKAAAIYLNLREIIPDDVSYRDAIQRCQDHIRLQFAYTEDTDWKTAVADISPQMAVEAFKRVHDSYLKKPAFKESAVAALNQMLLMAKAPKLSKVFEKLADKDEVEEFCDRINPWLARIQQREEVSLTDMIEIFDRVLTINKDIRLVPETVLIREFMYGVLKPLDRFSDMLWPAETEEFNKNTQGKFTGVGISIRKDPGSPIKVISPLEDTPAYRAGIRPGDEIMRINGKPAAPLTITQAVREITGPPDTTVTLTIKRPGDDQEFDLKLKRAEITISTIKGFHRTEKGQWDFVIDPKNKIGYVRLTNFMEETPVELGNVMKTLLRQQGIRGLIFDLRGNPGGLLKTAVDVTSLFLAGDKEVVSTRDRRGKDVQMSSSESEGGHYPDLPMIVLVNETSASASEILSGALQVHQRALVLGDRTYGKGSVQQILPVTPGRDAFIKLTTARYYLPNGRCLHRDDDSKTWGVDPDVAFKVTPKEMFKVANARMRSDVLKGMDQGQLTDKDYDKVFSTQPASHRAADTKDADGDDKDEEDEKETAGREDPNEWPETDAQLDAALLIMRVRLETNQPWPSHQQEMAATAAPGSGS